MHLKRKVLWGVALCLIVSFFPACTASKMAERKYLGKTWPTSSFCRLDDSGHNRQNTQHFDIEYDYTVNRNTNMIEISGTMTYNVSIAEAKYHSETVLLKVENCEVILLFADSTGKINSVKGFHLKTGKNIYDPLPFEQKIPFDEAYQLLRIGYNVYSEAI